MTKTPKPPGKAWSKHPNTKPGKRAAPKAAQAAVAPRPSGLPTKAALVRFLAEAGEAEKGDIARAFGLKGAERRAQRGMLRELEAEGALGRRGRKGFAPRGSLPPVGVADVVERDADGELYVRLTKGEEDAPLARLAPDQNERAAGAPGLGDRLLVRFERTADGFEARMIKRLGQSAHRVLGVVRKSAREVRVEPVDRKSKETLVLRDASAQKLRDGDLVLAQVGQAERRFGPKAGKVLEVVGREDEPRAASLIAIHSHGIPTGFSDEAEAEAGRAQAPTLQGRTDLRHIPLITIDPPDARDHDDAVYAERDEDPKNKDGWIVWVAIADVAAYVRAGSALDREAREKGNSTYFPDRVEPMLPHLLSSGLCSLVEGENRACLAVRMVFDKSGKKIASAFVRGLMRSAAKLSYEQAQEAIDQRPDDKTAPLLDPILRPLWAAYACLKRGRDARSPLAIESAERRVIIDARGQVASITARESLEAHRLIEEMMIQANVSAAEALEQKRTPLIYRIHDSPSPEKLQALADFLETLDIPWSKGEVVQTSRFNRLLDQTRGGPHAEIVNEVVLRTQMQAQYNPDNIGHFGLNLQRYAHFTSPIRRYADLVVHRGLVRALKLGGDGLSDADIAKLADIAEQVTFTERRSMAAERDATDRYVAAFLEDRVGAVFTGRITGVTRFGLFIRLTETGADGLVPVSTLGDEYFRHDDRTHALVGERTARRWTLGRTVEVRLTEATPITGGLVFEMLSDPAPADPSAPRPRLGVRRRGGPPPGVKRGRRR
jgi:ribonuclease R